MKPLVGLALIMSATLSAQSSDPIRYTVRFTEAKTHYISVDADIPVSGPSVEVFMPVWTPGSYLVREFAKNVDTVAVTSDNGKPLGFTTSRKNRWKIETAGAKRIHFTYRVYCREMSVRTNWVESGFALLNGAPTFVTLVGGLKHPHEVTLELPPTWKTSMTGLTEAPPVSGIANPHHYLAPDYDTIVDSPIVAGNPTVHRFEVDGIPHFLVNQGEDGVWDGPRSSADTEKIVRHYRQMWGGLPYKKYVFLNLLTGSGGGLEHKNSVCMMTSRWGTRTPASYTGWLGLVSHEYFHAWNVKRLRPVELGPFDYENENPTKSLWVAEGFTDYYASLSTHRAGLSTRADYLGGGPAGGGRGAAAGVSGALSRLIYDVQNAPGRKLQSAEQASLDAWIRYYRPNENSGNTGISYYSKGAVVAFLLDAKIRQATNGQKTLDDMMRLAYSRYSEDKGYTPEQFKAAAEEVAGTPLRDFFRRSVESTEELDYTDALAWYGLRFRPRPGNAPARASLGADTKNDAGRLLITRVATASPAHTAGLNVDDEILAIGDFRVRADQLAAHLGYYKPGEKVSVLIARRDKLERLEVTLGNDQPTEWQIEVRPDATAEQKQHLEAWLTGRS